MILTMVSLIPAAWALFIAFYLDHLNRAPHKYDFGPDSVFALSIGIVILSLCIAVPIRGVRLAATVLFSAFVVITFSSLGAWWLPGWIVAIIVTVIDWRRKRETSHTREENA